MKFALKEVFEKIQWDRRIDPSLISLEYIHRGAPNDTIEIPFTDIFEVRNNQIVIPTNTESEDGVDYIPFHRILKVWNRESGEILYKKAKK